LNRRTGIKIAAPLLASDLSWLGERVSEAGDAADISRKVRNL
jgi:hypothetical protein